MILWGTESDSQTHESNGLGFRVYLIILALSIHNGEDPCFCTEQRFVERFWSLMSNNCHD